MPYYLAIDAGGTKTDYVLADGDRELARDRSGTIKRMRVDAATAAARLDEALAELTTRTGVSMRSVHCTCIGTAGETVPLVRDWLREALALRVAGSLILLGDVEIALDAAFYGRPGVLALAGTGSNVAGRDSAGRLHRAGGWGPALGDQGSGHRIGQDALHTLCVALDCGTETSLLPAILAMWQLTSVDALVDHANQVPAPDLSQLTEAVLRCAQQGDRLAAEVLTRQGEELGALVRLVMRRLRLVAMEASNDTATAATLTSPLALAGSILENVVPVRASLIASVRREFPDVDILDRAIDPLSGALWRARNGR